MMRADGWCRVGRWASPDGCGAGGSVGSLSSRASSEHAPLCRMVWVWAAAIGGGWGRWEMQSEMGQPVNTSAAGWEVPQMRQRARSALRMDHAQSIAIGPNSNTRKLAGS